MRLWNQISATFQFPHVRSDRQVCAAKPEKHHVKNFGVAFTRLKKYNKFKTPVETL